MDRASQPRFGPSPRLRHRSFCVPLLGISAAAFALATLVCTVPGDALSVGVGKADITGPPAEVVFQGYAQSAQTGAGIEQRLWARAFVVGGAGGRVAFVVADLWGFSQVLRDGVLRALTARFADGRYGEDNVVLHATHTHLGPGGYQGWLLYDLTIGGFSRPHYERIVAGVVDAIARADAGAAPGRVFVGEARTRPGVLQRNRAATAQARDPEARQPGFEPVNTRMTLLRFVRRGRGGREKEIGSLNFFPLHPTSYSSAHRLITGDNKGYAEWLLEQHKGSSYVAAFGQSDSGDVSPNLLDKPGSGGEGRGEFVGPNGRRDSEAMRTAGKRQFELALSALRAATEELDGPVASALRYVDFANVSLPGGRTTCSAAVGSAMYTGTEDGRGLLLIPEGDITSRASKIWSGLFRGVGSLLTQKPVSKALKRCQGPKQIVLATGEASFLRKFPLTPRVLPVQVVRIGALAIAALPFEVTTVAGARLRKTILAAARRHGVARVELACVSNAYAGYMTTREEYGAQEYEGASTHFGPDQLEAAQLEFSKVAAHVARGAPPGALPDAARPPAMGLGDLNRVFLRGQVVLDAPAIGTGYGDVGKQPARRIAAGTAAEAVFVGSHPNNAFDRVPWYCLVERRTASGWMPALDDDHPDTAFEWRRHGVAASKHVCRWTVARGTEGGEYRFRARGVAKGLRGMREWEGASRQFEVLPSRAVEYEGKGDDDGSDGEASYEEEG
ncbi:Neutral/alkaline nonlysosomal ceramidase [Hyaloraphidium curvatum]|nr:Neutral/alkaline nonlysosomal ceramidase [Hyaloraphidium curvatum]